MTPNDPPPDQDLLGRTCTARERELLDLYRHLCALAVADDLPPCAKMNVRQAMVMLWNACADLGLAVAEPDVD